jgi:hypothetical protein
MVVENLVVERLWGGHGRQSGLELHVVPAEFWLFLDRAGGKFIRAGGAGLSA